jgi:hypothetical protein
MIEDMPIEDMARVLLCLDRHRQATVFGYFDHDTQVELAEARPPGHGAHLRRHGA